jgi:hypothetical protein
MLPRGQFRHPPITSFTFSAYMTENVKVAEIRPALGVAGG